tara:strand:- start:1252 stop:1545 length:294 start_codon:yes stop_codon:yes gene_type:complete
MSESDFVRGSVADVAAALTDEFSGRDQIQKAKPKKRRSVIGGIKLPEPRRSEGRIKITIEVDAELGSSFKEWCRVAGYQQRDVITAALENIREQHDW